MLPKILFPVDFSERARSAAHYAEALASRFQSELTLLYVVPPPNYAFVAETSFKTLREIEELDFQSAARSSEEFHAKELPDLPKVREVVLKGDVTANIVEYAHTNNIDLIVMPTHGYGPFRRFILGSVTAKVLHDVNCPVWTSAHVENVPIKRPEPFQNIVCALDLKDYSKTVLCWASRLAAALGARLFVVHAIPEVQAGPGHYYTDRFPAEEARHKIGQLEDELNIRSHALFAVGEVAKAVSAQARELRADLVVIGRSADTGLVGRLRTHAYSIIRESPCPVVSV